jgi:integrase
MGDSNMAKTIRKKHPEKALDSAKIRNAKPGRHADGNGLYLVVDPNGAKRWVLRTVIKRKRCDIGLGGFSLVTLAEAREEAIRLRKAARKGADPLAERRQARRVVPIFEVVAREVHTYHSQSLTNEKHKEDWISSMVRYVFPVMGNMTVNQIESKEILQIITPIWSIKQDTARRIKQRLKVIFDYARAKGWRTGDNPVDGVDRVLPKNGAKVQKHYPALPYAEVPEFIKMTKETDAALAVKLGMEFLILTASRTNEVIFAKWAEFDLAAKVWTVPPERMKMRREHRVPLSSRCLEILHSAKELNPSGEYVFPGRKIGSPLSTMCFLMLMRRMDRSNFVVHGFRSSFRNWCEEKTTTQRSVTEMALAHVVESKVEAAYLRTDLFEKRRRLMNSWALFATTKPAEKVVRIREA